MTARIQNIQTSQRPEQVPAPPAQLGRSPDFQRLDLLNKLQTTLELEGIIELFSKGIHPVVPHDGISYQAPAPEELINLGHQSHHSLNYDLKVMEEALGVIHLYRGRRFSNAEIEQLETLLVTLLYPLRNALLYRSAVQSAFIDALTGVKNRTAFENNFRREIEISRRKSSELSLIVLDIDWFKGVNDRYGHSVGDLVLKNVAQTVEASIRCSDALYRYGGEEFVLVLLGTDRHGAKRLAERIRQNVASLYFSNPKGLQVTLSLGVATMQKDDSCQGLFDRADAALYQAKEAGRNRVVVDA
jgi:diguanylate cyclase (GGDEF)-like protein